MSILKYPHLPVPVTKCKEVLEDERLSFPAVSTPSSSRRNAVYERLSITCKLVPDALGAE